MKRIAAIVKKEFRQIHADPFMARLIVAPVLIQLFVIGYALTVDVRHIPLSIVDNDHSPTSRTLVASIETQKEIFNQKGELATSVALSEKIFDGTVKAGVVIPPHFGHDLVSGSADLSVVVDGQDANTSAISAGYLGQIVTNWLSGVMRGRGATVVAPVTITDKILFNPMMVASWYMIPALVVLLVTIITSLLTGLAIVKEKESGTMEQLLVTPVATHEILIAKIIPFMLIGFVELMVFMALAVAWFGIPFRGSVLTLALFAFLYMISSLGIGILTSAIARTSQQVLFLIFFILIFFILLSGFFMPIENMPPWVQSITVANPVRHFMMAIRSICLRGSSFMDLLPECYALCGIGGVVFGTAITVFSRKTQ